MTTISFWRIAVKASLVRIRPPFGVREVRLYSRPGSDLARRFPLIVDALARLRSRSCIIDGEGIACDAARPSGR